MASPLAKSLHVTTLPSVWLLGKQGQVLGHPTAGELDAKIAAALASK